MIKCNIFLVIVLTFLAADTFCSESIKKRSALAGANSAAGPLDVLLSQASTLPVHDANSYASLAAAVTSIGPSNAVFVTSKQLAISSNLSIPSNIKLKFNRGGQLMIAKNAIVSINGPVDAGLERIFEGKGLVKFNKTAATKVYPQWWGAKGDGSTEDTQAVQKAINTVASTGGRNVIFSKGIYLVNSIVLDSNVNIVGKGWDSILLQKSGATYGVSVNPGNGGTPNPADNKHDITIRDIQFKGTVEKDDFSEHVYLLNLNAVTNIVITHCKFVGWRGDAIYIGSSNTPQTERHNRNVTISECAFDVLNSKNRNAITMIDGDNIAIDKCSFINCSRSDMPGAIDAEPNNKYNIVKNIKISGNKFEKIDSRHNILIYIGPGIGKLDHRLEHIEILDNIIISENSNIGISINQQKMMNDETSSNDISIFGNIIKNTNRQILIHGFKNMLMRNNILE